MLLSVAEAATVLGCSERAVRARLARGDLPGVKRQGRWHVRRADLPLDGQQRRALQERAEAVRAAVEAALPSRTATTRAQRAVSVADLEPFRAGHTVLAAMRAHAVAGGPAVPGAGCAAAEVEAALLAIAEGHHQFAPAVKLEALTRARAALGRAVGALLAAADGPPESPALDWVVALEAEVMPRLAGFIRWTEKLGRRQERRGAPREEREP